MTTKTMNPRAARAWQDFQDRVTQQGGDVLEACWRGSIQPHRIACASGHESAVRPNNLKNGQGMCATCAGRNPWSTETEFRKAVSAAGAFILGRYQGTHVPVKIRCIEGHEVSPTPRSVLRGSGICRACSGSVWDVFYVVTGPAGVKFGVTSGDPRPRLTDHRRDGYATVAALHTGLDSTAGLDAERACRTELAAAGLVPVRGREYYGADALPLVLKVAATLSR